VTKTSKILRDAARQAVNLARAGYAPADAHEVIRERLAAQHVPAETISLVLDHVKNIFFTTDARQAENTRVARLLAREQSRRIRNLASAGAGPRILTQAMACYRQERRTRALLGGSNRVRALYPA